MNKANGTVLTVKCHDCSVVRLIYVYLDGDIGKDRCICGGKGWSAIGVIKIPYFCLGVMEERVI